MGPELKVQHQGLVLYRAGGSCQTSSIGYPSNFNRDVFTSGILAKDPTMLRDQLEFAVDHQATQANPFDGAEPGKFHHEYPGVTLNGLSTEYNSADATAWALMAFDSYRQLTGDSDFVNKHRDSIVRAAGYITSHLTADYLFAEDPEFSGASRFALKVTYWKDSQIPQRDNGEPVYPVSYSLAHFQNMAGLRSAAGILGSQELRDTADKMSRGVQTLFNPRGAFEIALDRQGAISGVSSDSLSALFFLEPQDIPFDQIGQIIDTAKILETPAGYVTLDPEMAKGMKDKYHATTVWPVEQAMINAGLRKFRREQNLPDSVLFRLEHAIEVSGRITTFIEDNNSEIFIIEGDRILKGGCDPQLWTQAANDYFAGVS